MWRWQPVVVRGAPAKYQSVGALNPETDCHCISHLQPSASCHCSYTRQRADSPTPHLFLISSFFSLCYLTSFTLLQFLRIHHIQYITMIQYI